MSTQCEVLDVELPVSAETPAATRAPGEWRYTVGGTLVMAGALGLLAVLADEALGGAVTEVLMASLGNQVIFTR